MVYSLVMDISSAIFILFFLINFFSQPHLFTSCFLPLCLPSFTALDCAMLEVTTNVILFPSLSKDQSFYFVYFSLTFFLPTTLLTEQKATTIVIDLKVLSIAVL